MSQKNQTCFRCEGLGEVYEFEGGFGEKSKCKGCEGKGTIPEKYNKCLKCEGKGQVYEYEEQSGNSFPCPFCNDKGYTIEKIKKCPNCEGDGKLYAFQKEKMGATKICNQCNGNGFIPFNTVNVFIEEGEKKNIKKKVLTAVNPGNATQGQKPPEQGFVNDLIMSQLVFNGNSDNTPNNNLEAPINKVKSNQVEQGKKNEGNMKQFNKMQTNVNVQRKNLPNQQENNNNNLNNNVPNVINGGYQFGGIDFNDNNNNVPNVNNGGYQFGGIVFNDNNNVPNVNNGGYQFGGFDFNGQGLPFNNFQGQPIQKGNVGNNQNVNLQHQMSYPPAQVHNKGIMKTPTGNPVNHPNKGKGVFNNQMPNIPSFASFVPKNIPKGYFIHKNSKKK